MAVEESWKGSVSYVADRCPTLSFGDRSKIASDLWDLQKAERDALRAQRDAELERLQAMRLAEKQRFRETQEAERQYARIERAVLRILFLLAVVVGAALFVALSIQATWDSRECQAQLAATQEDSQQRAARFAQGLAEMQQLTRRLAQP